MGIAGLLKQIGIRSQNSYLGQLLVLTYRICATLFKRQGNRRSSWYTFIAQTFYTGVEAIPQIALMAMVVGALTIMQAVTLMPKLGGGDQLGGVMVAVVLRELGPLMTAIFIAGRSGSAMSTYIGNMRVLQEVDALKSMGVDPLQYLIMPAFFATIVSLCCLTMIFNFVAVLGGYFLVWAINIIEPGLFSGHLSFTLFIEKMFLALGFMDVLFAFIKPVVFGLSISVIACYHGMSVGLDVRAVPRATRVTVVRSFVAIIMWDLLAGIPVFLEVREKLMI